MPFERLGGLAAFAVAAAGFLYSVFFFLAVGLEWGWAETASWILLLAGGLLTTVVFVALFGRLREVEPGLALLALLLALVGAVGQSLLEDADAVVGLHHPGL